MGDPTGPATNHTRKQTAPTSALAGKVTLVTGASGGIGQAVARRLASDGARWLSGQVLVANSVASV